MSEYTVRPLGPDTWDAFAALAERHNGVWGGCWCTWFHTMNAEKTHTVEGNRSLKEQLVRSGRAHAALVFDGDLAVAWCQYGAPAELPNINHRKEYEAGLVQLPAYRLTCFFVDKKYRRKGVAAVALQGALQLIAQAGGGMVEAYPQDTKGQKVSASHLYSATRSLFEQAGFHYDRSKGAKHSVMSKTVPDESALAPQSLLRHLASGQPERGGTMADWKREIGAMTLFVPDLGEAQKFYADLFGLDAQPMDEVSAMLKFEEMYVFLRRVAAAAQPLPEVLEEARNGAGQFAVIVEDVDAVCAEIAGRGLSPITGPADREWGMRTATYADPGGYIWEIAQNMPSAG